MQNTKLGASGIEVTNIGFGCWAIAGGPTWGTQDERDALEAIRAAYDGGVTFFDTAEAYGFGASEQIVGKALAGVRGHVVIASKVMERNARAADLRAACERSLKNLKTDYIDLYQMHWPAHDVPVVESFSEMEKLQEQGKIRAYGVSNFGVKDLGDLLAAGFRPVTNQIAYNLVFRAVEFDILPMCRRENISVLAYSPIMQGLLTGKWGKPSDVPDERARTRIYSGRRSLTRHGEDGAEEEIFEALGRIEEAASRLGRSMGEVAVAWVLAREPVVAALVGGRNAGQARSLLGASDIDLSPDTVEALAQITGAVKERLGPNADMWKPESETRIR
ncbi:MAG: aldo/keto reductase [Chitinivibrionales bacterium]|nr:aldo/keto reductase [Chitinivibrionales bacterium]MBD3395370.1 aldo/keto reductase [Chitinivibrionales bacterium]